MTLISDTCKGKLRTCTVYCCHVNNKFCDWCQSLADTIFMTKLAGTENKSTQIKPVTKT